MGHQELTKAIGWVKTKNVGTCNEHPLKKASEKPGKSEVLGRSTGGENESETTSQPGEGKVNKGSISCCQTWKCLAVLTVSQTCYTSISSHTPPHTHPPSSLSPCQSSSGAPESHKDGEGLSSIPCHELPRDRNCCQQKEKCFCYFRSSAPQHVYMPLSV